MKWERGGSGRLCISGFYRKASKEWEMKYWYFHIVGVKLVCYGRYQHDIMNFSQSGLGDSLFLLPLILMRTRWVLEVVLCRYHALSIYETSL